MTNLPSQKRSSVCWLTPELKEKIRKTFEVRYKRKLSDCEVVEIASNLVSYVEHFSNFVFKNQILN